MTDRVGIIGIATPAYREERTETLEELVHETSRAALEDADIGREELDNLVVAASDLEDGRSISSMVTACPAGSFRRDFIKSTDTGVHALGLAAMRIQSGLSETTLVSSWAKGSEVDVADIRSIETDPVYRRNTGLGHVTGHAANATAYADRASDATEAAAHVVEKNTTNAVSNPLSQRESGVGVGSVDESPVVSWPLREAHLPEPSDGATALVLAGEERALSLCDDPIWIEGLGWETGPFDFGERPAGQLEPLKGAANRAYDDAGISPSDLDAAEVHCPSAFHELMAVEALGLAGSDAAAGHALEGTYDLDGETPVNPSGGPYAGNPLIAAGLARVTAAVRQLRGTADGCQVDDVERIAAHASAGITDQVHGVATLRGGAA